MTPAPPDDGADLVRRCAKGDEVALGELYDRTSAVVHGLVVRIVRDPGVAEEVTGDVYLQAWRQAERWDPGRGKPLAWLLTMARSRAIDRLRGQAASRVEVRDEGHTARAPAGEEADPEESAVLSDRRQRVLAALAKLSAEERQAIELAFFGGLSHSEIAERLQAPLGTVKTRIRLGMLRLRKALGEAGMAA